MAILKCSECGGDVSTSARSCPHCGYDASDNCCYYCSGFDLEEGQCSCCDKSGSSPACPSYEYNEND